MSRGGAEGDELLRGRDEEQRRRRYEDQRSREEGQRGSEEQRGGAVNHAQPCACAELERRPDL